MNTVSGRSWPNWQTWGIQKRFSRGSMNIRAIEMRFLDKLFDMESGYVLDFSNRTFSEFFEHEVGLDIYDDAYALNGTSKAKRLRTFLQIGQQAAVTKALHALWEYREATRRQSGDEETVLNARDELSSIIERLGGSASGTWPAVI